MKDREEKEKKEGTFNLLVNSSYSANSENEKRKKELEDEFNVSVVVIENKMPNSISLTQQGVPNEVKILLN